MIKKTLLSLLLITVSSAQTLVFGVVPQQSPNKLFQSWKPFIEHLSKQTGIDIVFRTEKSIPEFEKKLYNGEYDIAYSNPYHYTIANKKQNHEAIVRFDKQIEGILVVDKKSKINTIEDIKDKQFLFPAPKAFAATILTQYEILENTQFKIDESEQIKYVNSHDSVYIGIQRGIGEVGGGIKRTFSKFQSKDQLKIIYTTNKYPSHPISIKSSLEKNIILKIEKALLQMPTKYLHPISNHNLVKTNNDEYSIVKRLAIKLNIF